MQVKFLEDVVDTSPRLYLNEATQDPLLVVPDTKLGFQHRQGRETPWRVAGRGSERRVVSAVRARMTGSRAWNRGQEIGALLGLSESYACGMRSSRLGGTYE